MRMFLWKYGLGALVLVALVGCGQAATSGGTDSGNTAGSSAGSPAASAGSASPAASSGAGANSATAGPQGGSVTDQTSLIEHFRSLGYTVEEVGPIEQPFLQGAGTMLRISGGSLQQPAEIQVFNYESADAAESDASQIGPDGNPRTAMITWIATPHFFRSEQVIALYIGDDQAVVDLLTQALGPQFAGG